MVFGSNFVFYKNWEPTISLQLVQQVDRYFIKREREKKIPIYLQLVQQVLQFYIT